MKKRTKWVAIFLSVCCIGLYFITGIEQNSANSVLIIDSSSDNQMISESFEDDYLLGMQETTMTDKVVDNEENITVNSNDKKENSDPQAEDIKILESNKKETETQTSSSTNKPTVTPTSTPDSAKCGDVGHTADGTCPICGKVKISNCNHNRVTNNICRLCGADVCMSKGHTEIGVCPVCDSVKHSSQGHTEKGVCDACGSTITFVEGATEHYHGDGTDNGVCPVCGLSYSPMIDTSKPSGADDVSHVFEYHFNPAYTSCPACGLTWCPTCQSPDHTVHPTPAPTCGAVGHSTDGTCGVCGSVYTTPTCGAIGHSSDGVCSVCGSSYTTQIVSHYHGNGSDNGVCPVCGLSYSPSIDISGPSGADDGSDIFG